MWTRVKSVDVMTHLFAPSSCRAPIQHQLCGSSTTLYENVKLNAVAVSGLILKRLEVLKSGQFPARMKYLGLANVLVLIPYGVSTASNSFLEPHEFLPKQVFWRSLPFMRSAVYE